MRNRIFIIPLLILGMNAKAQNYIPMVRDGNKWHLLTQGDYYGLKGVVGDSVHQLSTGCFSLNGTYNKTTISKLAGDSIVGQTIYKKIFSSTDSLASVWELAGLIREDTVKQTVYYKRNGDTEKILYAFNVKVKDTVGIMVVQYVDTILIGNKPHKRIGVLYGRTWIEGIGGLSGLLTSSFSMPMCGPRLTLLCMYNNNSLLYKYESVEFTKCFYWDVNTGLNTLNRSINYTVYPNPSSDNITVKVNVEGPITIKIKDLQGRIFINRTTNHKDTQIDLNGISPGIYFVEISNKTNGSVIKLMKK